MGDNRSTQSGGRVQRRQGTVLVRDGQPFPNRRTTVSLMPGAAVGRWLATHRASVNGVVLDLGCGNQPYRLWLDDLGGRVVAVDAAPDLAVSARGMAACIPLRSQCVDTVLATEVLEHVEDPDTTVREMFRVLRPGGLALVTIPFMYPTHEAPYDFRRFTYLGLEATCEDAGFEVQDVAAKGGPLVFAAHMGVLGCVAIAGRICGDLDRAAGGRAVKYVLGATQDLALRVRLPSTELNSWSRWISLGYMLTARKPAGAVLGVS